jgi:cell division initiation protein
MPLTPLDIHNKEFTRGFRGYDEDEVNEFLDQIIKDYEMLMSVNKELYDRVQQLEDKR